MSDARWEVRGAAVSFVCCGMSEAKIEECSCAVDFIMERQEEEPHFGGWKQGDQAWVGEKARVLVRDVRAGRNLAYLVPFEVMLYIHDLQERVKRLEQERDKVLERAADREEWKQL